MLQCMKNTTQPATARQVFAYNVRLARRLKDLSQEALALQAGMSRTYVSEVERGERNISIDSMSLLAQALGVPLSKLVDPDGFEHIKL
jgi:transcriptional regulator with XRE-family HTH domain